MKVKIQIKNYLTGSKLFEHESDNNTIKETLQVAFKRGADLRGADLRGAYLRDVKIKSAAVLTGLYKYAVIPYITESNELRIKLGCYDRLLSEWESDFWNNPGEFPNDGSIKSKLRLMAFETAKKWLEINNI